MEQEMIERLKPAAYTVMGVKAKNGWNSLKAYEYMKALNECYGFTGVLNWCILPDAEVVPGPSLLSTKPIARINRLEEGAFLRASSENDQLTANDIRDIQQYDGKKFTERQYKRRAQNSLLPWHYYTKMRWPNWEDIPASAHNTRDNNDSFAHEEF